MDITSSNIQRHSWKRIKLQYVTTFAGLALAVSSVVAVASSETGHQPSNPQPATMTKLTTKTSNSDLHLYYLVASEEQRDALIENALGDFFVTPRTSIVVIKSVADELTMGATQAELTDNGHAALVMDLRGH